MKDEGGWDGIFLHRLFISGEISNEKWCKNLHQNGKEEGMQWHCNRIQNRTRTIRNLYTCTTHAHICTQKMKCCFYLVFHSSSIQSQNEINKTFGLQMNK